MGNLAWGPHSLSSRSKWGSLEAICSLGAAQAHQCRFPVSRYHLSWGSACGGSGVQMCCQDRALMCPWHFCAQEWACSPQWEACGNVCTALMPALFTRVLPCWLCDAACRTCPCLVAPVWGLDVLTWCADPAEMLVPLQLCSSPSHLSGEQAWCRAADEAGRDPMFGQMCEVKSKFCICCHQTDLTRVYVYQCPWVSYQLHQLSRSEFGGKCYSAW